MYHRTAVRARLPLLLLAATAGCAPPERPVGAPVISAIALRDRVPGYQQVSSREFTLAYLEKTYDRVEYITQALDEPTGTARAAFTTALQAQLEASAFVDVYLLTLGENYLPWFAGIDPSLRAKLRLIYNTGGGGARQAPGWLALGARTYVAHPGPNSWSPLFYLEFLPAWTRGVRLEEAVSAANQKTKARLTTGASHWALELTGALDDDADGPAVWAMTQAETYGDPTLTLR